MFKKLFVYALSFILFAAFTFFNATPVFFNYTDRLELYIDGGGSAGVIVSADKKDYPFIKGVSGESFKADKDTFDLDNFLNDFSAKIILTEEIAEGVSYYAFSNKIKYRSSVRGKTVNLHIFVGETVTVGSPLIFGSF